jgi:hypothetical protein
MKTVQDYMNDPRILNDPELMAASARNISLFALAVNHSTRYVVCRIFRRFHPRKNDGLNCQKSNKEDPQVEGRGKDDNRYNKGAGKKINGDFFLFGKTRAADPPDPGAKKAVVHDPPVKPPGTFHKAKGRGQQKRGRRQYRKGNAYNAQGKQSKTRNNKQQF